MEIKIGGLYEVNDCVVMAIDLNFNGLVVRGTDKYWSGSWVHIGYGSKEFKGRLIVEDGNFSLEAKVMDNRDYMERINNLKIKKDEN